MRAKLGSVYQRKKRLPDGSEQTLPTWWIKYYRNGKPLRESSGSGKRADAEALLKKRGGDIVTGKFLGLLPERILLSELFQDVVEDYETSEQASLPDLKGRLKNHLTPFFEKVRATEFSTNHLKRYIKARRKDEATNATINRELSIIRRAFNLAAQSDPPKVARVPYIEMLPEENVRTGFLEHSEYVALRNALPDYIRPLFVVAYHVGGRRGELSRIQWRQVDLDANQIRLHGPQTKGRKPRTLPIYGDMKEWLEVAKRTRDENVPNCPWAFFSPDGVRLYWFYDAWDAACIRAGLPGFLFHDLRRSAVRNMERAGIPRNVGKRISGHKTDSVYERYDIVVERDLNDAGARLTEYLASLSKRGDGANAAGKSVTGTLLGTPDAPCDSLAGASEDNAGPKPGE